MRRLFVGLSILTLTLTQNQASEAAKCGTELKKAIRKTPEGIQINKTSCPTAYTILMWLRAQKTARFFEAKTFIKQHPDWPRIPIIQRQLENDLQSSPQSASEVINWFHQMPPVSINGLKAFAQALTTENKTDDDKFNQTFLDLDLSITDLKDIISKFRPLLSEATLERKANLLLDKNQIPGAEFIRTRLTGELKTNIETRLAIMKDVTVLPTSKLQNPNIKFEQIRIYRKNHIDLKASKLLQELTDHDNAELVWAERNLIARRLLEDKKYQDAYDTIKNHGLKRGENFANAEWLAGWISLRFLKNPEQAKEHFDHLNSNVSTPMSAARAQYWLGRAYKDLDDMPAATTWWTKAKKHLATYYGQLAHKELTGHYPSAKPKSLSVDTTTRRNLESQELYQCMRFLQAIGESSTAEAFALKLGEQLKTPEEQALLTQVVHDASGRHSGLKIYKKIMKTEYPLLAIVYPRINIPSNTVEPAFANAIIRQESRFQHDAVSSAGAMGLMQLMPATAKRTEQTHKIKKKNLTDPHHNVRLGSHHLKDLMNKYNGSMILSAAAYNAGGTAVDSWIEEFGDPRSSKVDLIDWIEMIPYAETRNYVQRVMENYRCYS